MPFRPYHNFDNRVRLEQLVNSLHTNGNITPEAYENFNRYHPAMIHKLKSAKYNLKRLEEKLTTTDIQEAANSTGNFMFEVNMYIDGFFYNAGSAMDILARVVLTLFGEPLTGAIYFQTAHARINASRPNDAILSRLSEPPWRQSFLTYRNTSTHELILALRYHIEVDATVGTEVKKIIFPLPDDPRATPSNRAYRQNPNALEYASQHFRRVLRLANIVYGEITERATAADSLPI
ncbi:hypothetical protein KA005_41910 [bacterium]|nr:hypothetical protein [bacterium]